MRRFSRSSRTFSSRRHRAFTLVELLVVIGIIALLVGVLMPALAGARRSAQTIKCASNIRQIVLACMNYADENRGFWPIAQRDGWWGGANLERWSGSRPAVDQPIDFDRDPSPLKKYMSNGIKACPAIADSEFLPGVDSGNGGYGYNANYIGGTQELQTNAAYEISAKMTQIHRSSEKIAFADTAFGYDMNTGVTGLHQYAFVDSTIFPYWGGRSWPTIHFRHDKLRANIAWADGHVTGESMAWSMAVGDPANFLAIDFQAMQLGGIGPIDTNDCFDRN
jgi:prepilin-type processing-associated H-X9-DG protein/prepilin-type N-terminal cleavage/methylation domain-containing protein